MVPDVYDPHWRRFGILWQQEEEKEEEEEEEEECMYVFFSDLHDHFPDQQNINTNLHKQTIRREMSV